MKTLNRIPSCLAAVAAVAIVALPIFGGPVGWHERLLDPATFLTALAFAGIAMVTWPMGVDNGAPLAREARNPRPEMRRTP
jgi:drug/metabolite transporter (DMT)-like permease